MKTLINKQNRLIQVLGVTGMTYLSQNSKYYYLFQWATLFQVRHQENMSVQ